MKITVTNEAIVRWTSVLAAFAILLLSGWVHGMWSGRWQENEELEEAVARVDDVPLQFGHWRGEALEADKTAFFQAGAQGYWMRKYSHVRSDNSLLAILMCGRSGRMAVHTPEVCYRGAGYTLVENPSQWSPAGATQGGDAFWKAKFRKDGALATNLRLYWGWNARAVWQAPDSPRWEFRGEPFLYKLYVSHETGAQETPVGKEFMEEFLPVLQKSLFPPPREKT